MDLNLSVPETSAERSVAKRAFDAFAAFAGLLLAAPVLGAAMLAVRLEDRGPALYFQDRVGLRGRSFRLVKLRSMRVNSVPVDQMGQVRADNAMVTRTGRVLRRLKLDELPQLWNVLVGEMSLVGPRPTIASQVEKYDPVQARRLTVRPGLSGWAQVNGNTEIPWEDRIALDLWYVDHWSMRLDLRILLKTIVVVLGGERADVATVQKARTHANRIDRGR